MDSKAANKASSPLPTALTTSRNTQIVPIVSRRILLWCRACHARAAHMPAKANSGHSWLLIEADQVSERALEFERATSGPSRGPIFFLRPPPLN
jgi:hypothetical protein